MKTSVTLNRTQQTWRVLGATVLLSLIAALTLPATALADPDNPVTVVSKTADRSFSPNSDQQEDTFPIRFSLSEAATATVTVTNVDGDIVRTLIDNQPDDVNIDATWDGLDDNGTLVADGLYTINLSGTDAQGDTVIDTIQTETMQAIPGSLTSPLPGSTVNGTITIVVTPTGAENITVTSVRLRDPSFQTMSEAADGTWQTSYDTTRRIDGFYRYSAEIIWTDRFGTVHAHRTPRSALLKVENAPVTPITVTSKTADRSFSPNDDGQEDTFAIRFAVSEVVASATVTVTDSNGDIVRTLIDNQPDDTQIDASWDGLDDNNVLVADGLYTINLTATDAQGDTVTDTIQTEVTQAVPASLTSPLPGSRVNGTITITATPVDDENVTVTFARLRSPTLLTMSEAADGTWQTSYDTTTTTDGDYSYYAEVFWTDRFAINHTYRTPTTARISIGNATVTPVTVTSKTADRSFSPNDDGQEDTFAVRFSLSEAATATVTVTSSDGDVVRTLIDNQPDDAQIDATWDGLDDNNTLVADGLYTINLTATDAEGDTATDTIQTEVSQAAPGGLTSPLPGSTVNGTIDVTVTPTDDENITVYAARFRSPLFLTMREEAVDGTWQASFDTTRRTDGDYSYYAEIFWTDRFGTNHLYRTPTTAQLTIDNASVTPIFVTSKTADRSFSPNADGQEDTFRVRFSLSEAVTSNTVTVTDSNGDIVRNLLASQPFDTAVDATWDGLDDGNTLAADGLYTINLTATDAQGDTVTDAIQTEVSQAAPASLTSPLAGSAVNGTINIVVTPVDDENVTVTSARLRNPAFLALVQVVGGTWQASYDTTTRTDGDYPYSAEIFWTDRFNASHRYSTPPTAQLTIDNAAVTPVFVTSKTADRSFSPNADGQEDTFPIRFSLSEAATATVTVTSSDGVVVRTLIDNQPDDAQIDATWDGLDDNDVLAADGLYTINLTATDAQGDTVTDTIQTEVTQTLPGSLTSPPPGSTVNGTINIVVTPVDDENITVTSARLRSPRSLTLSETAGNTWQVSYDTTTRTDGEYTYYAELYWTDRFGASHFYRTPTTAQLTIDNAAVTPVFVTSKTADRSFSPNADGQEDSLAVSFSLSEAVAGATVTVTDSNGDIVRTLIDNQPDDARIDVVWDGRDDDNTLVADGLYTINLTATDAQGDTVSDTVQTEINQTIPGGLTSPLAGSTVNGTINIVITPTNENITVTSTRLRSPAFRTMIETVDGTWQASYDTTTRTDGDYPYYADVTWTDRFGTSHVYRTPTTAQLTIDNAAVTPIFVTSKTADRSFSPNADDQEDTFPIRFSLSEAATATVAVTNSDGVVVRTLIDDQPDDARIDATWDGLDDNDVLVADGLYTINLTATDAQGDTITDTIQTEVTQAIPGALTSPPPGSIVNGTINIAVTPVDDENVTVTSARLRSPASLLLTETVDGVWQVSYNTTTRSDGDYSYFADITWTDSFGASHLYRTPTTAQLTIDNAAVTPVFVLSKSQDRSFSPNADGQEDTITVSFSLSEAVNATVTVTDSDGDIVRTLIDNQVGEARIDVLWDGRDDNGGLAATGLYTINLSATDDEGDTVSDTVQTEINQTIPGGLTSPLAGSTVNGTINIVVTPTNENITVISTRLRSPAFLTMVETVDGSWQISYDTASRPDGNYLYYAEITWTDRFGRNHTYRTPTTAQLTINNTTPTAPVAAGDDVGTDEDVAITIDVLANDSDVDGDIDPTTLELLTEAQLGSAQVVDGQIEYTPAADANGADSFSYRICDLEGLCDEATVSVDVAPVNDAPTATDDETTTMLNTTVLVPVLANDADVDGDALTVDSATDPANGSVQIVAGGVEYTPNTNYCGSDSFTYVVSDGAPDGQSEPALVSIEISCDFTFEGQVIELHSQEPLTGIGVTLMVAATADGPFEIAPDSTPQSTEEDGRFSLAAGQGFYRVDASAVGCDDASSDVRQLGPSVDDVVITIDCNNPPTINDAAPLTVEAPFAATDLVAPSASDLDGDVLTFMNDAPASFTLGETAVVWTVIDADGASDTTIQLITVTDTTPPELTAPTALMVEAETDAGTVAEFTVTATDSFEGVVAVTCSPASGTVFAPGDTSVSCTAADSSGNSASASFTVTVIVVPVEIPGTLRAGAAPLAGVTVSAAGASTVTDSNGDFALVFDPETDPAQLTGEQTVTTPAFMLAGVLPDSTAPLDIVLPELVQVQVTVVGGFYTNCSYNDAIINGCIIDDVCTADLAVDGLCDEVTIRFTGSVEQDVPGPWNAIGQTTDNYVSLPAFDGSGTFSVTTLNGTVIDFDWDGSETVTLDLGDPARFWYPDNDGDTFGDELTDGTLSQDAPFAGAVPNNRDCNDNDESINPDATDIPGNLIDEDCDGIDTPIPDSLVTGQILAGSAPLAGVSVNDVFTDDEGRFTLSTPPTEDLILTITSGGQADLPQFELTRQTSAVSDVDIGTIDLPPIVQLEVQVEDQCITDCDEYVVQVEATVDNGTWTQQATTTEQSATLSVFDQTFEIDASAVEGDASATEPWDGSNPFVLIIENPQTGMPVCTPTACIELASWTEQFPNALVETFDDGGDPERIGYAMTGAAGTDTSLSVTFTYPRTNTPRIVSGTGVQVEGPGPFTVLAFDALGNEIASATNLFDGHQALFAGVGGIARLEISSSNGEAVNLANLRIARPGALCRGLAPTIVAVAGITTTGTSGDDVILGTAGPDIIRSRGGNDIVCARGGNDWIVAGAGNDVVYGGSGDDDVWGSGGDDVLIAGQGNDKVRGGGGADLLLGRSGTDKLWGNAGDDRLDGGADSDWLYGGGDDDVLLGRGGDDRVWGGGGHDTLRGAAGYDRLWGGSGNDDLAGGRDDDFLRGGNGNDRLRGGAGADRLWGGNDVDNCAGGGGTDLLYQCEPRIF